MSVKYVQIECFACGHTWRVNLERLDEAEIVAYRDDDEPARYRAQCPNCDTYNTFPAPEDAP